MSNFDNIVEIEKYNHYHDELGRFTFAPGGGSGGGGSGGSSGGPTRDCYGTELSEGQRKYFANSEAVDEDGNLVEVYHGTVHDFTEFDTSLANPENDMGMGIYLTNNYEDVDANYANEEGPDLQLKIEQYSEHLINQGMDFDEADQLAHETFVTADPQVFTCYLNIENPVKLGGKNETIFDYNDGYDPETDEYGEESGTLLDFHQALTDAAYSGNYEIYDADGFLGEVQTEIFEDAYDGISAADVAKIVKRKAGDYDVYMESSYGDYKSAGSELLRETFENMGFDGIIDSTVSDKFARMRGMDEDTVHYIVFNSNQVKLVENTNPTNSPDITKALRKARGEGYALYNLSKVDQEIFQALTRKAWDGEKRDLSKLNKAERGVLEKLMEKAGKHKGPRVSKALLFWDFINKKNPYHDKLGRFTTAANAVGAGANSMIRTKAPPKNTKVAYKVFYVKDGKLYPPMVANRGGVDTPVGVWLDAQEGERAGESKTGRPQVKSGGKGTKGGSGKLAYRPGWHLGELPKADQFYTKDKKTGEKLQYENFVWAECDIAADIDYQEEAMSYGYTKNGKFRHSYAGLPKLPTDGCYKYRTNPDPNTKAWYITGAMKVNRILTDDETDAILRAAGEVPMKRKGGKLDLEALGIKQRDFTGTKKSAGTAKSFYDALQLTPKTPKQNNLRKSTETEQEFNIFKTDEDKRLVFGWANVAKTADGEQLEDLQKDIIDPEDLEEAVYKYVLDFRDGGEEHIPSMRKKASLVESVMFTKEKMKAMGIPEGIVPEGWWIGFYVKDDDAWSRIKDGTYKMFSIEGRAVREDVEQPARKSVAKSFKEVLLEKFNPYHDHLGRFTTGPGGGGGGKTTSSPGKRTASQNASATGGSSSSSSKPKRQYGSTDTKDAVDEINSGRSNSLQQHMDANGNLTPEREAVHKKIIDDILHGKKGETGQATMTMLGGGPASGKSSVINSGFVKLPDADKTITVDPDFLKSKLPGYEEMATQTDKAAGFYHEESSALAKRLYAVALSENINVTYDGTGNGSYNSAMKKIKQAKAAGYKVNGEYVTIDTEEALRRNRKRYEDGVAKYESGESKTPPRLPPEQMVIKTHTKVTNIAVQCAPEFDSIKIYDNNGPKGSTKLIATGGSGKGLVAVDKAAFDRFLAKGDMEFMTLPDGQVVPLKK